MPSRRLPKPKSKPKPKLRTPNPPAAARWADRVEQRSLVVPKPLLKLGQAHWRAAKADLHFHAQLVREACETRAPELTLAYRNLVWMVPGFRQRERAGKLRLTGELCVVFVVRDKGSVASEAKEALPRWLTTYADRDGERQLFAIPTDVQDVTAFHQAAAHTRSGVWVHRGEWPDAGGSVTCLVQLDSPEGSQTCVLSAQHVLSPFADADSLLIDDGWPLLPLDASGGPVNTPDLGLTLPYGGVLRGDEREDRPSFDVQLARADAALRERVALRRFDVRTPFIRDLDTLLAVDALKPFAFQLLTPDNHVLGARGAIRLTLRVMAPDSAVIGIPYVLSRKGEAIDATVFHAGLIAFTAQAGSSPLPGDSGSPIVIRRSDGAMTLVGMHIGGDGAGLSWAIPAWQLFDLDSWRRYPADAQLRPVNA